MMITNSKTERWIGLIVGLLLNALGQGLCIVGAMGSGIWTAAAINLNAWQGWNIGSILIVSGFLNAVTNQILIKRLDLPRFLAKLFTRFLRLLCQYLYMAIYAAWHRQLAFNHARASFMLRRLHLWHRDFALPTG